MTTSPPHGVSEAKYLRDGDIYIKTRLAKQQGGLKRFNNARKILAYFLGAHHSVGKKWRTSKHGVDTSMVNGIKAKVGESQSHHHYYTP